MLLLELAPLRHERVFRYARVAHCPVSGACVLPVWLAAKGKREPGALACMRCNNGSCICQQGPDCPRNGEQVRVHHALHGKSMALGLAGSHCFVWALCQRPHRYEMGRRCIKTCKSGYRPEACVLAAIGLLPTKSGRLRGSRQAMSMTEPCSLLLRCRATAVWQGVPLRGLHGAHGLACPCMQRDRFCL